jgi:hypothetical protein
LWAVQAELSESNLGVQQPPPQEDVCHCALWPWAVGWTDVSSHTHLPFSLLMSVWIDAQMRFLAAQRASATEASVHGNLCGLTSHSFV